MNKAKKIIIISVVLGLVGIMALTTLILALVPVNKNRTIETPNVIYITNEKTTGYGGFCASNIDDLTSNKARMLNEFMEKFNAGFEQKALVSLFAGQMNEGFEAGYADIAGSSEKISKNYDTTEKFTVIFEYNETKTITVAEKDLTFEYDHLFFEVTNTNGRELVTFGVMKGTEYMDGEDKTLPYKYYYTAKVNLSGLYKYICSIPAFKTN
jgi:hypothetical protein